MSGHTKGTWAVRSAANGSAVTVRCANSGATIATVKSDHPDTKGRKVANARLIAAAPGLLEALKLAVRQNSHDMLMTGEELRICTAAIAAATGENA